MAKAEELSKNIYFRVIIQLSPVFGAILLF